MTDQTVAELRAEIDRLSAAQGRSDRDLDPLELLLAASVSFSDAVSLDEVGPLLADTALRSFSATHSAVYLLEGGAFALAAGRNPLAEFWTDELAPGARTRRSGGSSRS